MIFQIFKEFAQNHFRSILKLSIIQLIFCKDLKLAQLPDPKGRGGWITRLMIVNFFLREISFTNIISTTATITVIIFVKSERVLPRF